MLGGLPQNILLNPPKKRSVKFAREAQLSAIINTPMYSDSPEPRRKMGSKESGREPGPWALQHPQRFTEHLLKVPGAI